MDSGGRFVGATLVKEEKWLRAKDPRPLLKYLGAKASKRKRRLFGCACCRQIWELLQDGRSRNAVVVAERFSDGLASTEELNAAKINARAVLKSAGPPWDRYQASAAAACVAAVHAGNAVQAAFRCICQTQATPNVEEAWHAEQ